MRAVELPLVAIASRKPGVGLAAVVLEAGHGPLPQRAVDPECSLPLSSQRCARASRSLSETNPGRRRGCCALADRVLDLLRRCVRSSPARPDAEASAGGEPQELPVLQRPSALVAVVAHRDRPVWSKSSSEGTPPKNANAASRPRTTVAIVCRS